MSKAYRARVRADNWANFSMLRHRAFRGMLVSSKNSGTHWLKYMFALALAKEHDLAPPAYFSEAAVQPFIGHPKDAVTFQALPRLAFSHTIPHRLADWPWARALAGLPPYVLLVRHPMDILASHYAKWSDQLGVDWLTYLRGDPTGRTYRCDMYWLARFWNRWGALSVRMPAHICQITYEASLIDPAKSLHQMAAHWGVSLGPEALAAALAGGTKEAMAAKVDPDGERNVLQNRPPSAAQRFQGEALEIYCDQIDRLFAYSLGYDLKARPT